MGFVLDERLERSSRFVADLPLCQVRIQDEVRFPWIVLIPRKQNIEEVIDLEMDDQHQLAEEIAFASHAMRDIFSPHKLNIGALGNQVRQLHVHVIARYEEDLAWPNPVWGYFELSSQYSRDVLQRRIAALQKALEA